MNHYDTFCCCRAEQSFLIAQIDLIKMALDPQVLSSQCMMIGL